MNAPSPAPTGLSGRKLQTLLETCVRLTADAETALWNDGDPADRFLARFFRSHKQFGSRDRRCIAAAVFAFFRWRGWIRKLLPNEETPSERDLALALAAEDASSPILSALLERAFPGTDAQELLATPRPEQRLAKLSGSEMPLSDSDLVPAWTISHVPERVRGAWLHSLRTRPAVWLRSNRGSDEDLAARLREAGFPAERHPLLPTAIRLADRNVNLIDFPPFRDGDFEVQDFSSQCIGEAAPVRPGSVWWDCCAGAGGKTLQLAARGAGRVVASDVRTHVLKEIVRRARRIPLRNIRIADVGRAARERFDGALADVPCSASGRWRRNPEMRWILSEEELAGLVRVQEEILERAADAVVPNGFLVYGTCSVFQDENEDVVRRFLARRGDFSLHPFPNPAQGGETDGMLRTNPDDADCDGSFVAVFRKRGGPESC